MCRARLRRTMGGMQDAEDLDALHARYFADRSPEIAAELVRRHEGLAGSLACRFAGRGEPVDDLRQVALMALLLALDRFDPGRGLRFSTFAVPTIVGELKRYLRDRAWLVKPPRLLQERYLHVQGAVDYLEQELGRPPTLAEIGAELGLEAEDVAEALEVGGVRRAVVSLDAGVGDDESMTFVDVVGGDDPAQALAEDELFVDALVHSLPEAERDVVVLSYFGNMSQREVGSRLGKSQMQVSRTKERALERLRRRVAVAS